MQVFHDVTSSNQLKYEIQRFQRGVLGFYRLQGGLIFFNIPIKFYYKQTKVTRRCHKEHGKPWHHNI